RIGPQRLGARADSPEVALHPLEQPLLAVDAADARRGAAGVHGRLPLGVREELVQRVDVALLGRTGIAPLDPRRIGGRAAQLVPDLRFRLVERDGVADAL